MGKRTDQIKQLIKQARGKKDEVPEEEPLFPEVTPKNFREWVETESKKKGVSPAQIVEETFHDGWLTFVVEESGGYAKIDASQMFKKEAKKKDKTEEIIRLRREFAPISACVDHIRNSILGGGVGVVIDDGKVPLQKEAKEYLEELIEEIYQDEYTRSLQVILPILVDDALTTGVSAAELTYETQKTFWDYATVSQENKYINVDGKNVEVLQIDTTKPNWEDLKKLRRMKIFSEAYKRFKLYRDPVSWEAKYWSLDEAGKKEDFITLSNGIKVRKSFQDSRKDKPKGAYFHTWQIFWLALNRRDWGEKGTSIITPVYGLALLFEKILKAVGEGIHRAGNKKYFIVCGTEKRPWSGPHVRNVLQQLKEASEKNWSTIPMPRGFGIEEIGGEVFEAEEVVAYFKTLIARGMNVPSSILGVFVRDEPEHNYKLLQVNLAMAIKHQLFKRHIWCKYGERKNKQGGRADKSTYVPNVRFRVEDLLTPQKKLEMFVDSLNVANPLHSLVKLKIESEYCRLMGWDDVLLPTQEEFKKELDEGKKLAEQKLKDGKPETAADGKVMGPPKPMTAAQQKKRLEGMGEKGPEKGKSKPMGGTRKPKEVKRIEESASIPESPQKIELAISVKSDPQEITLKLPKAENELAEKQRDLAVKQKELAEKKTELAEEESKKRQKKLEREVTKLEEEIAKTKQETTKIQVQIDSIKAESKAKIESISAESTAKIGAEKATAEAEIILGKEVADEKKKAIKKIGEKLD